MLTWSRVDLCTFQTENLALHSSSLLALGRALPASRDQYSARERVVPQTRVAWDTVLIPSPESVTGTEGRSSTLGERFCSVP